MREALSDEQWAAMRALVEGEMPTQARVAACAGVNVTTLSHRAGEEGWQGLNFRRPRVRAAHRAFVALAARARAGEALDPVDADAPQEDLAAAEPEEAAWPEDEDPGSRIARIGDILTRRTEAMLRKAEAGGPLESRQIAALAGLVQLAERIAVLAREKKAERQIRSDEETGAVLKKIDDRIRYLTFGLTRSVLMRDFGIAEEEVDKAVPHPDKPETWDTWRRPAKPAPPSGLVVLEEG